MMVMCERAGKHPACTEEDQGGEGCRHNSPHEFDKQLPDGRPCACHSGECKANVEVECKPIDLRYYVAEANKS
jgi:hypothetical protein